MTYKIFTAEHFGFPGVSQYLAQHIANTANSILTEAMGPPIYGRLERGKISWEEKRDSHFYLRVNQDPIFKDSTHAAFLFCVRPIMERLGEL